MIHFGMADYSTNWDNYYRKTYRILKSKSLWDVSPELSVKQDQERFKKYLTDSLPVIDVGCGSGEQAAYLKNFYKNVLGLDVSQQAIDIAKQIHEHSGVAFSVFDISDPKTAKEISDRLGPCHLYMRGILHQTLPEDKMKILESISILLKGSGRLYFIEVAENIKEHLLGKTSFTRLPESMQMAMLSNLPPRGLSLEKLQDWFPQEKFSVKISGKAFLATNLKLPDDSTLNVPAVYGVVALNM